MDIEKILLNKAKEQVESVPRFFDLSKLKDKTSINKLLTQHKIKFVVDDYDEQLREYFQILNPSLTNSKAFQEKFQSYKKIIAKKNTLLHRGIWAYFPWNSTIVKILPEYAFFSVRTARNQNLITKKEQEKFYNSTIGIAGLSVGNSVALAIVLQGGGKHIRLADFDSLALSNLNRIRSGVKSLGLKKVELTARQIYELNPYTKIELFPEGITKKNISKFCRGLDVLVDEIDNLGVKFLLRIEAKKLKLPVIMGADNGESAIIDIERYDKNFKLPFFHGRLNRMTYEQLQSLNKFETGKTIAQLIGLENHTEKMLDSLMEMGKSIVSWPQLGGTATLNGSAVAYCIRQILNQQSLEENRAIISLDESLQKDYFSKKQKLKRLASVKNLKKIFNIELSWKKKLKKS